MSLSVKPRRVIRAATEHSEVFVLGETTRLTLPAPPVATAEEMLVLADARAEGIVAEAHRQAAEVIAEARAQADRLHEEAFASGFAAGQQRAADEMAAPLELVRRAAAEGKAIRDGIAGQSADVIARATALAVRRIVADYYEAGPERTAAVCAEALRAAAGQEVLSIRVSPGLAEHVQATLAGAAHYVAADDAVAAGGCIIDLRYGTIDATLDTRLSLMEIALANAGGVARS